MHLDPFVALSGFIVGVVVGMTGMGGGALMTPILVLLFNVNPLAAVSSDLVASMVMKPVGAGVHLRRGTVRIDLVRWLMVGSVPAAFAGVFVLRAFGTGRAAAFDLELALGATLLLSASLIVGKGWLATRRRRVEGGGLAGRRPLRVRPLRTVAIGIAGGLIVGMTSVGSGSLIIVALMLVYPSLAASELVGTDLTQAVPLVASAAVAHILFGDFRLGLTASLLLGSLPGVFLGARMSSRAPDGVIRPALVFVLLASALRLLGMPASVLGPVLLGVVLAGMPAWALVDAAGWPRELWARAGLDRRRWIGLQAAPAAGPIAYFAAARPRLAAAAVDRDRVEREVA